MERQSAGTAVNTRRRWWYAGGAIVAVSIIVALATDPPQGGTPDKGASMVQTRDGPYFRDLSIYGDHLNAEGLIEDSADKADLLAAISLGLERVRERAAKMAGSNDLKTVTVTYWRTEPDGEKTWDKPVVTLNLDWRDLTAIRANTPEAAILNVARETRVRAPFGGIWLKVECHAADDDVQDSELCVAADEA